LTCVLTCRAVPSLFERVLQPPSGGFGLTIFINVYNSIFYFVLISVAYAVVRL